MKKDINKNHIKTFEKEINKYYKEQVAIYVEDKKELNKILKLVKDKKYVKAYEKTWDLDASIRDIVPSCIYDYIERKYEEDS